MPKADFSSLHNPLVVSNLYGKGGRFREGDEKGVSFSLQVAADEAEMGHHAKSLRNDAEYYAKVRMANKEGYIPVVVTFELTEKAFSVLQGKIGIPHELKIGHSKIVQVEPISTFDELVKFDGEEVVIQAGRLTSDHLRQLGIEVGTADVGKEGQKVSLTEALNSKSEFNYKKFKVDSIAPEGSTMPLGEKGTMLK